MHSWDYYFAIILQIGFLFAHFHIFAWILNDGCFEGFGNYISELVEACPIASTWVLVVITIGHFGFGLYPLFSAMICIIPYYLLIKWLVKIGSFHPNVGG